MKLDRRGSRNKVRWPGHDGAPNIRLVQSAASDALLDCLPLRRLALVALGVDMFDNLDFERLAEEARRLGRYELLFTAAPLRIEGGMGSPLNPIATFLRGAGRTGLLRSERGDRIDRRGAPGR